MRRGHRSTLPADPHDPKAKDQSFRANGPTHEWFGLDDRLCALRDFNQASVRFGSVASHPDLRGAPGMSAMPSIATQSGVAMCHKPTYAAQQCGLFDHLIGPATPTIGLSSTFAHPADGACPGRKYLVGVVLDDGVAFAGNVFERRAVEDLDVTAAVADQAGALQEASRDGHRGAPHAEHLSEKLLRQRDDIAVDAVVRLQQPTAKSGLEAMQRIARNRLLDLRKQDIVVAHDEVAEGRALGGSRMKLRGRDPRGRARQLHDRACDG